jgi:hypothetical protein
MDTAGNSVSLSQQPTASQQQTVTGFAIPIDTALSVARQIAAGHASFTVTIGYPPFIGIGTVGGSQTSPQAQAQEKQNGFGDGFGGFGAPAGHPGLYTSNASLIVPSVIAPVGAGALVDAQAGGQAGHQQLAPDRRVAPVTSR